MARFSSDSGFLDSEMGISPHPDNSFPVGLAINGEFLYVADEDYMHIIRYLSTGGLTEVSRELRQYDGSPLGIPSGAMFDDGLIWVVDRGTNEIYGFELSSLFPDPPDSISLLNAEFEYPLDSNNDYATGL